MFDNSFDNALLETLKTREATVRMEERKQSAIASKEQPRNLLRIPHILRFSVYPGNKSEIELEIFEEGERQGRIQDIEQRWIFRHLRSIGVDRTLRLEQAIDSAYNFGQAVYFPSDDSFVIPNDTDSVHYEEEEPQ